MLSIYVDTGSLVKFYYPEADSDNIEAVLLKADRIHISYLSVVEIASALSKKVRMNELKQDMETVIWNTFLDDIQTAKVELIALEERHYLKGFQIVSFFKGNQFYFSCLYIIEECIPYNSFHILLK